MKNDNPLVSVIIPTYNRARVLKRAIKSVLSQTFQNFELLIVDDGSTDSTRQTVNNFTSQKIEYIRFEKNKGAQKARNTGIKKSKGSFVAFLDDDDEWLPKKLEKQIKCFRGLNGKWGVVYSGRRIIRNGKVVEDYIPDHEGMIFENLLYDNLIPSPTPIIRRECFDKVGLFDIELESSQDHDMWLRISKCYKVSAVKELLAIAHKRDDSISSNPGKRYKGKMKILKKYYNHFKDNPKALSNHYRKIGIDKAFNYSEEGDYPQFFKKAFTTDRKNLKSFFHYTLSKISPKVHRSIIRTLRLTQYLF